MNWLNIYTPILRSPEFIGSEPVARATWLSLLAHCVEQENGGLIQDCDTWKDRQWQQTCGVTRQEIDDARLLAEWSGQDLRVIFYPHDKEAEVKAKREGGRRGGVRSTQAKAKAAKANGAKHNPSTTQAELEAQPKVEPKGREGKGREEEGEQKDLPLGEPAGKQRQRNPLFDSLAQACGSDPMQMTPTEARACAVALAGIRKASPQVTALDFAQRALNYHTHYTGAALTPSALSNHWSVCAKPNSHANNSSGNSRHFENARPNERNAF